MGRIALYGDRVFRRLGGASAPNGISIYLGSNAPVEVAGVGPDGYQALDLSRHITYWALTIALPDAIGEIAGAGSHLGNTIGDNRLIPPKSAMEATFLGRFLDYGGCDGRASGRLLAH